MYRIPSILGRQTLRSRSQLNNTNTSQLLENPNNVINGRVSCRSKSSRRLGSRDNPPYVSKAIIAAGLGLGGTFIVCGTFPGARRVVEEKVPIMREVFNVFFVNSPHFVPKNKKKVEEDLPSLLPALTKVPEVVENVVEEAVEEVADEAVVEAVEEVAVVVEEIAVDVIVATDDAVVEEVVTEATVLEEEDLQAELVEVTEETSPDVALIVEEPTDVIEAAPAEELTVLAEETTVVPDEVIVDVSEEYVVVEAPEVVEEEMQKQILQQEIQRQTQILVTEAENLRIILDDTATTKSSAIRMMHGYIAQFSQALLVVKQDPAYTSIWDAIMAVDHSIRDSIALVKTKESEVKSQVDNMSTVIVDLRTHGDSEVADKAEKLIATSHEQLGGCEAEMCGLMRTVDILLGLRERIDASPERLQTYLRGFVPDLLKLLGSGAVDLDSLSIQDALLMLSLERPSLVYAQQELRDAEKQVEFEAILQQQKEEVFKEAESHLGNVLEQVQSEKSEELEERVLELKEEHANHLAQQLQAQEEQHQQLLREEAAKLEAELAEQHRVELEAKLKVKEDEHQHEVEAKLSTLGGIESKIVDVLEVGSKSRKTQQLWAAVHALSESLNDIVENGRSKKLSIELSNILGCDENDPILAQIISSFPDRASKSGVIPETVLFQDFKEKKRLCQRVAYVDDTNKSLMVYAFSYIKSWFVISSFYRQQPDQGVDIESLGPFEILEKAEYFIEQGDLEQAAKFMSQLKGVGRKLCAGWLDEVRLLLETKLLTNFLKAYAGSIVFVEDE